ncbi:MAG: hypothetical protein C5B57_14015 [Blastocatellia bacterium]|nr:MAG: hypothetical protein C5B57_14015 [Blastocatellia bacterium]
MAKKRAKDDPLFSGRWVHVFEDDTPDGQVYRLEDDSIPLSRRPRERLELDPGGGARVYIAGPDDRFVEEAGTWSIDGGAVVIRLARSNAELRVVSRSAERLVVKVRRNGR